MTNFVRDLLAGLSARPRRVAPKWFYDSPGSRLFDRICALPEYYLTRVELGILESRAVDIARCLGPGVEVVEFGAGTSRKFRAFAHALERPIAYRPIDISGDYLLDAITEFRAAVPELPVHPIVGDYTRRLSLPPAQSPARRAGFYPGSSIGNFAPVGARALLGRIRRALDGGGLLIGVDLVKDPAVLHAAYNDAEGVTAEFNLNLWARANREAGADFDLSRWAHSAFYNAPARRIEMHLVSRCHQRVSVARRMFEFGEGDSVCTEFSYKYTVEGFQDLAKSAGWQPANVWIDAERQFSLHWLCRPEGRD